MKSSNERRPLDSITENKSAHFFIKTPDNNPYNLNAGFGPKISVVTVSYNSAATIADTLNSVRGQSYNNIEHILVDGDSSDNTLDIIKSFCHISKCISEKDNGIYDAINKGLSIATGDIIGILNSDDVYTDEHVISKVAEHFESRRVDTLYADLDYVNETNPNEVIRKWKSGSFKKSNFNFGWMPPHPTFFVRKEVYQKVGVYSPSLTTAADYEMMLRILFKYSFTTTYLPSTIVKMRAGGTSNCSFKNRIRANKEDRIAWKVNKVRPYFFTLYLKPVRKIFQFINFNFFIRIAIFCIKK